MRQFLFGIVLTLVLVTQALGSTRTLSLVTGDSIVLQTCDSLLTVKLVGGLVEEDPVSFVAERPELASINQGWRIGDSFFVANVSDNWTSQEAVLSLRSDPRVALCNPVLTG